MNECAGADSNFTRGIPSSLSYYSVDIYDKGANEVIRVREYYEKNIFPKLQNNTKVFVVPGIFGNPTQPMKPQQELLLQKCGGPSGEVPFEIVEWGVMYEPVSTKVYELMNHLTVLKKL